MPTIENLPDEITIEQIREHQFESICYQSVKKFGGSFNSTSFFINRNFLLTSAHNVKRTWRKVRRIKISPARVGNEFHLGTVTLFVDYTKHIRIFRGFRMNSATQRSRDLALIYIPERIINSNPALNTIQYFPILEDSTSLSSGETVYCAGYPATGNHSGRYRMTLDTSTISEIQDNYFKHKLDTRRGNSGSPIMVKREGQYYIVGINSIADNGTFLNEEKKAWIEENIQNLRGVNN